MKFSYGLSAALIGAAIVVVQPQIVVPQISDEQAIAAIAKEVTVIINGQNPGSGVIISKQGNTYYVLTAKHVVATQDEYEILTFDGTKHKLDYRTVKKLPGVDLAIVQFTSNQNYRVAVLGDSEKVKEGATVYTSGWPHPGRAITDRIYQVTQGRISGRPLKPLEDGYALVYTNITRSGMSGGPVLDDEGRVIAIHGRAEGEPIFNPDTGATVDVKSGFNLGIPINSFFQLASQAGVNLPYSFLSFYLFKTLNAPNVNSVAISPDSQTLASGHRDSVKLWNLATGELKRTLSHSGAIFSVVFSPDGQSLISGGGGTIKIWNLRNGQLKSSLSGNGPLAIAPDGQTLASISSDEKAVQLWNLQTGQSKKILKVEEVTPSRGTSSLAFSPDSQKLAVLYGSVGIWNLASGAPARPLALKIDDSEVYRSAHCVSISPDGQTVVTDSRGGWVRLWNLNTGKLIRTFESRGNSDFDCDSFSLNPHGQVLVSGDGNQPTVNLWNLQTGRGFYLPKSGFPVTFSPDGRTIVTAGPHFYREVIKIWRSPGR